MKKTKSGWIAVGKFVKAVAEINGKNIDIHDFRRSSYYTAAVEIMKSGNFTGPHNSKVSDFFIEYKAGFGESVRSSYAPFKVFQLVALWADTDHLLEVLTLLERINEVANATDKSAYDILHKTIEDLEKQIEVKDKKIETLESQVTDLTLPTNKLHQSYIYAKQIGNYFHLKYKKTNPKDIKGNIKQVAMVNAKETKEAFHVYARELKLTVSVGGKWLCKLEDLDKVFEIVNEIKQKTFNKYKYDDTNELIANEISKIEAAGVNQKTRGKLFELQYAMKHDLLPWKLLPSYLLQEYNENANDTGIDLVKVTDGVITEIYQIKCRSGSYLTANDIATFITKCGDSKYANCRKILVLKNCKISKKLHKQLHDIEIEEL